MKIGDVTVKSLLEGFFRLDGGSMFGIVPKPVWSKVARADSRNRILLAMRPLLVAGPGFNLLVDVGIGRKEEPAWKDFYEIDRSAGGLQKALKRVNLIPHDITDVVLTHLHFDHAGGLTYEDADGNLQLSFPAAVHHVRREHWEWAQHPPERDASSFTTRDVEFVGRNAKLNIVEVDTEIRPAVHVVNTGGHAPGHQVALVGNATPILTLGSCRPVARDAIPPRDVARDAVSPGTREDVSLPQEGRDSISRYMRPPGGHLPKVRASSGGNRGEVLVYCGDLIPTAAHIRLPYVMAYDHDPNGTIEQKRRLLSRAAQDGWVLVLEHDPRIVAVKVKVGPKGFEVAKVIRL
jgi:glyoxylase-like metal-dependent hydrolase (beta-lactamase superfamily II)